MSSLVQSVDRAELWLRNIYSSTEKTIQLRHLGLVLCDEIRLVNDFSKKRQEAEGEKTINLSTPFSLITMSRNELLSLLNNISVSDLSTWLFNTDNHECWAKVIGGLSLSYARLGDISVVAALVRVAAQLNLWNSWLADAHKYLLDQQHSDGFFGYISRELSLIQTSTSTSLDVQLHLTVEVLWALAETAQHIGLPEER